MMLRILQILLHNFYKLMCQLLNPIQKKKVRDLIIMLLICYQSYSLSS